MKLVIINAITFWQRTFAMRENILRSFGLTAHTCKYTPTCSQYTKEAVQKYGILRGIFMGLKRVFRCNPWNVGGYDPVS
jgi:uncharacterized protein